MSGQVGEAANGASVEIEAGAAQEPLYNIGVVARLTGVPVTTLRVWERRYGFPSSVRTEGGHRLFSEAELRRLRWVKARVDEGMQAGQAVRALAHLEREGRAPETPSLRGRSPAPTPGGEAALSRFGERLAAALETHDLAGADRLLGELLALFPLETLLPEVILPAWHGVGEAYEAGRVGVATEHLCSQYLRHRLIAWLGAGPPEQPVRPTVLACAPGEWHEGSLLALGVLLRRQGWPVAYLGQALPLPDLAAFVREARPPAVVLVAMTAASAAELADWPRHLPELAATGRPLLAYGGRAFAEQPALREGLAGLYLGDTVQAGLETLAERLRAITGLG